MRIAKLLFTLLVLAVLALGWWGLRAEAAIPAELTKLKPGCPSTASLEEVDVVFIPEGCPSPVGAWLITNDKWRENSTRITGLEALVKTARSARDDARVERDACREEAVVQVTALRESLRVVTTSLEGCTEPPDRGTWFALGSGAGAVTCIAGAATAAMLR